MTDVISDVFRDSLQAIGRWIVGSNKEILTVMRQPTPIKISSTQQAVGGVIGGGLANPQPVTVWSSPLSHEAWINRITITVPGYTPASPLTTGQIMLTGSTSNEILAFAPVVGMVAPLLITEGRLSAAHLNTGEQILMYADGLPANALVRLDFQIVLVTGVSSDVPKNDFQRHMVDITP